MQNSIFFLQYLKISDKIILGGSMTSGYIVQKRDAIEYIKKGYKIFDSGQKSEGENYIMAIIVNLLCSNKFDSLENLMKYNENNYKTFLKNNKKDNIPLHFGNSLNNDDFQKIISNYKKMQEDKMKYSMENVNVKKIDSKEYIEYNGQVLDNSYAAKKVENELSDMQRQSSEYQSLNQQQNTDRMMREMSNTKKEEINFTSLDSIEREKLNNEEQKKYDAALVQEYLTGDDKKISLNNDLIKDDNNNIAKLDENDNNITFNDGNTSTTDIKSNISLLKDIDSSKLSSDEKDLYNAAINYQLETDNIIRLDLANKLIILPDDRVKDIITDANGNLVVNDDKMLGNKKELENAKVKILEYSNPNKMYNSDTE